jgi:hypothetical protein
VGHKNKYLPVGFGTKSFREMAEARGISVSTLKRQIKERCEEELNRQSENALRPQSAGWNPRAGNRKRVK